MSGLIIKVADVGVEKKHRDKEGVDVEKEWEGQGYVERIHLQHLQQCIGGIRNISWHRVLGKL